MSEFDYTTERCVHCDGHWRHYHPCPYLNCAQGCEASGHTAHTSENSPCCGLTWDSDEQVGDCIDCGHEWFYEGRRLHFGASGMFCCTCAESRRNGEHYVV